MDMAEVVTVPLFAIEPSEDQIGSTGAGGSLKKSGSETAAQVKATSGIAGQNHVNLSGLVAFGGLKELQKKSPEIAGQTAGVGLGRWDMLNIAPAQGKGFGGSEPAEPKEEFSQIGKTKVETQLHGGIRMLDEPEAVGNVPLHMFRTDGGGRTGFRTQPPAHTGGGHADEEVVGGRNSIGPKHLVLRAVGAAGRAKGEAP